MIYKVLVSLVTGKFYGTLRFKFWNHLLDMIQQLRVAERFGKQDKDNSSIVIHTDTTFNSLTRFLRFNRQVSPILPPIVFMFPLWTFAYGEGYVATWLSSLAAQLCQDMSALAEIQQCTPYQKQSKHYLPTSSSLQSAAFRGHALFDLSLLHLHSGGRTGSPYFVPDFQSSCKP